MGNWRGREEYRRWWRIRGEGEGGVQGEGYRKGASLSALGMTVITRKFGRVQCVRVQEAAKWVLLPPALHISTTFLHLSILISTSKFFLVSKFEY